MSFFIIYEKLILFYNNILCEYAMITSKEVKLMKKRLSNLKEKLNFDDEKIKDKSKNIASNILKKSEKMVDTVSSKSKELYENRQKAKSIKKLKANEKTNVNTRGASFKNSTSEKPCALLVTYWNDMVRLEFAPELPENEQTENRKYDYKHTVSTCLTRAKCNELVNG